MWESGVGTILSGGAMTTGLGAGVYASPSIFNNEGEGLIGSPARITFRWMPAADPDGYADWAYPLGINFQCAYLWMTKQPEGGVQLYFSVYDQPSGASDSVTLPAVFVPGTWYEGVITVEAGRQTLSFLGHEVEFSVSMHPDAFAVQPIYLNMSTNIDGSVAGLLDFIKIESLAAPMFWTNLRNAQEVA